MLKYYFVKFIIYFLGSCLLYVFLFGFDSKNIWLIIVFMSLFFYHRLFERKDNINEIYFLIKSAIIGLMLSVLNILLEKRYDFNIIFFWIYIMISLPILVVICKKLINRFSFFKENICIIYDCKNEETINNWFAVNNVFGYEVKYKYKFKYFDENRLNMLENLNVNTIVLAVERIDLNAVEYLRDKYRNLIIFMNEQMPFYNVHILASPQTKTFAFILQNNLYKPVNLLLKNIFDFIFASLSAIVLMPLFIILYGLIRIIDKQNPIFKQLRLGYKGKNFYIYKFKTMSDNSDEILKRYLNDNPEEKIFWEKYKKLKNDPRVTKFGKFLRKTSLDELPQIINVLKGEMSLVGPRPYLPQEKEEMGEFYSEYIKVKPGITGLWQVSGRNELTFLNRIKLDKWYIKNWSLEMDFMIFLKTLYIVLKRKGSY